MTSKIARAPDNIARKTLSVRHRLIRTLAPQFYKEAVLAISTVNLMPRAAILYIKEVMNGKKLCGAEIGVAAGVHAEDIMTMLNMKKLYLIDPYEPYVEVGRLHTDYLADKQKAALRLKRFGEKVEFIYQGSDGAATLIPNGLDFVYIDGNHTYEYVKSDIETYYPKITDHGVLSGHDFGRAYNGDVVRAVVEFVSKHNLKLEIGSGADWFLQKGVFNDGRGLEPFSILQGLPCIERA